MRHLTINDLAQIITEDPDIIDENKYGILAAGLGLLGSVFGNTAQAETPAHTQNQPTLTAQEKRELKLPTNNKAGLQRKLDAAANFNVDALRIGVRADVIANNILNQLEKIPNDKTRLKQFLNETTTLLKDLYKDKQGTNHTQILNTLYDKYDLQNNPQAQHIKNGTDDPIETLKQISAITYKLTQQYK